MSSEFDLAAACCLWPPSPRATGKLDAALAVPIDWDRFLKLIHRHRIFGLVAAALGDHPAVPGPIGQSIDALAREQARVALQMSIEAIQLDRLLTEAGVPVAFVKGAPLAWRLHGTIGLRHARDLDLLVPLDDLAAARRLLEHRGYRRVTPSETLPSHLEARYIRAYKDFEYHHPGSGVRLELHWRFFDNRHLIPEVPPPERWVGVDIGTGASLRTLDPADELLYLCLHGAATAWFRLKWLADIETILAQHPERLRPLVARARAQNLLRPVAQALLLCQRVFGTVLPGDIEAVLRHERVAGFLAAVALDLMTTGETVANFTDVPFATTRIKLAKFLLKRDGRYLRSELGLALSSLEDWITLPLRPSLSFLYPLLRVPLWVLRKARQVRKSIRWGDAQI